MSDTLPDFEDVRAAAARLAGRVLRTPLLRHRLLDEITGATVLVKPEPLQRTGSFKLRGATNAALLMEPAARRGGIVTHSSGNHGQACAAAAHMLGMRATIAMPSDAPAIKVEATRRWGAEIIPFDRHGVDRDALAETLAAERGATVIPPFDHPHVIAGQGTVALELIEDAQALGLTLDAFAVCTGGGGLTAGCVLALEALAPKAEAYAVEPEGWDDTARSLAAGRRIPVATPGSGLCDALLSRQPGALTFAINHRHLAGGVVVTEAEILRAMRFAFEHLKVVAEPGGAVALAAVLAGKVAAKGGVIGVVISGGNADPAIFARALAS
ncbi:threonine/serine dehydratase [Roseomonas alkaliterrae]|uniref:Threonine dehydratase n=1 Tax=Neoroseomonas alkaliterrae TaxID=1452450 RepID=A0A840Y147_9PROT|nr:threonine/serine dehydratase [Neoroseomonas alkaliterrae]MBB5688352.1 threonine dehydratase [Neoroseomonas alkaliterrae]MBR0676439.1 threonine/serine dehydratase [Neoroseomonas alkaliterrae]